MTREALTQRIKELAREAGFTKAGITSAEPFDEAASRLDEWVRRGMHGLMGYMERGHEKRRDVREIMPNAKSIDNGIAVATINPARKFPRKSTSTKQGMVRQSVPNVAA